MASDLALLLDVASRSSASNDYASPKSVGPLSNDPWSMRKSLWEPISNLIWAGLALPADRLRWKMREAGDTCCSSFWGEFFSL